jgi:hypothetical protein
VLLKKRRGDIYVFLSLSHRYAAVRVSLDLYKHVNMPPQNHESAIKVFVKGAHEEHVFFPYTIIKFLIEMQSLAFMIFAAVGNEGF